MSHENTEPGTLYIVATPIGNLDDMVPRAIDILQKADLIAAEDTRHSTKLLRHFNIDTRLTAYHDHSDDNKVDALLQLLQRGQDIALISDAGTPLISDPGYRIVNEAHKRNIRVSPIPGPSAFVAAISVSGLPCHQFSFLGFPPAKQAQRIKFYEKLAAVEHTQVFYESPHRILPSLNDMMASFGEQRPAAYIREVSKAFETVLTGSLVEIGLKVQQDPNQQRGELVVCVAGHRPEEREIDSLSQSCMNVLLAELPIKKAAALTAKITGGSKNALYEWALNNRV